jgi:hypothetical protein
VRSVRLGVSTKETAFINKTSANVVAVRKAFPSGEAIATDGKVFADKGRIGLQGYAVLGCSASEDYRIKVVSRTIKPMLTGVVEETSRLLQLARHVDNAGTHVVELRSLAAMTLVAPLGSLAESVR